MAYLNLNYWQQWHILNNITIHSHQIVHPHYIAYGKSHTLPKTHYFWLPYLNLSNIMHFMATTLIYTYTQWSTWQPQLYFIANSLGFTSNTLYFMGMKKKFITLHYRWLGFTYSTLHKTLYRNEKCLLHYTTPHHTTFHFTRTHTI
jgi:hypothetical protein